MKLPTHSKLQEYKGLYSDLNKLFEIVSRDSGDILIRFNESESENVEDISAVQGLLQKIQNELDVSELNKVDFNSPVNTQKGTTFDTVYYICNDIARRTRQVSYEKIEKYLNENNIKIKDKRITNGSTSENNHITIEKGDYEGFSLKHNIRIVLKGCKKSSNDFITKDFLKGGKESGIIEENKHWVLRKESIATIKKTILSNVDNGVKENKLKPVCKYIIEYLMNKKAIDNTELITEKCDPDYQTKEDQTISDLMSENSYVLTYFSEVFIPWMILNKIPLKDINGQEVNLIPQTYRDKNRDIDSVREVAFPTDPSNKETDSVVRFDIDKPPVDTDELEDNFRISSKANGGSGCSLFNIFTENFVVEEDCSLKELYEVYLKYKGRPNYQPISIYEIALKDMLSPKDFNNIINAGDNKEIIPQIFKAFTLNDEKQIRLEIDKTIGSYKIYDIIKQAVTSDEARKKYSNIVNMNIFINQFPVSMTGFCCRYLAGKLNKDEKSMEIIKREFTKDRFYQYHTGITKTRGLEVDITEVNEENQRNIAAKVQTKETLTTNKIGHGALVTRFSQNDNE